MSCELRVLGFSKTVLTTNMLCRLRRLGRPMLKMRTDNGVKTTIKPIRYSAALNLRTFRLYEYLQITHPARYADSSASEDGRVYFIIKTVPLSQENNHDDLQTIDHAWNALKPMGFNSKSLSFRSRTNCLGKSGSRACHNYQIIVRHVEVKTDEK